MRRDCPRGNVWSRPSLGGLPGLLGREAGLGFPRALDRGPGHAPTTCDACTSRLWLLLRVTRSCFPPRPPLESDVPHQPAESRPQKHGSPSRPADGRLPRGRGHSVGRGQLRPEEARQALRDRRALPGGTGRQAGPRSQDWLFQCEGPGVGSTGQAARAGHSPLRLLPRRCRDPGRLCVLSGPGPRAGWGHCRSPEPFILLRPATRAQLHDHDHDHDSFVFSALKLLFPWNPREPPPPDPSGQSKPALCELPAGEAAPQAGPAAVPGLPGGTCPSAGPSSRPETRAQAPPLTHPRRSVQRHVRGDRDAAEASSEPHDPAVPPGSRRRARRVIDGVFFALVSLPLVLFPPGGHCGPDDPHGVVSGNQPPRPSREGLGGS